MSLRIQLEKEFGTRWYLYAVGKTILQANRCLLGTLLLALTFQSSIFSQSTDSIIAQLPEWQSRVVKLTGAGGFERLESHQSGCLISPDGLILTVWSYVLDGDVTSATLYDGRKFDARLIGYDPESELAVLQIEDRGLPHFDLNSPAIIEIGSTVFALSNLYGIASGNEPVSVLRGSVLGFSRLNAKRGGKQIPYREKVMALDVVTSNPGSPGGAVVNRHGLMVGVIGKELQDANTNAWISFAIPSEQLKPIVDRIMLAKSSPKPSVGRPPTESLTARLLGLELVPDILPNTPPFVERTRPGSAAELAGIKADDLIVEVNGILVQSIRDLIAQLELIDRDSSVTITVERNQAFHQHVLRADR